MISAQQMVEEQYLYMDVVAIINKEIEMEGGNNIIILTIRPKTNKIQNSLMLSVEKTKTYVTEKDLEHESKEIGRLTMVQIPQNRQEIFHVNLELHLRT